MSCAGLAIDELRQLVESALEGALPVSSLPGNHSLNDAIRAAVFPGGKRFRPIFTLLAANAAGVPVVEALDAACAVEFLHCSSLVFDDLPCMDDAGVRRNRPALHKAFGESTALLAGLALFSEAYRLFGRHPRLISEAADCVGVDGMIGGQSVDVGTDAQDVHTRDIPTPDIQTPDIRSRDCKTSGLMRLTFAAGCCCGADAPAASVELLASCGERLGFAYQVLDDLLDDCGATGKTAAQDARHSRPTHTDPGSAAWAIAEVEDCCEQLRSAFGMNASPLVDAIQGTFSRVSNLVTA